MHGHKVIQIQLRKNVKHIIANIDVHTPDRYITYAVFYNMQLYCNPPIFLSLYIIYETDLKRYHKTSGISNQFVHSSSLQYVSARPLMCESYGSASHPLITYLLSLSLFHPSACTFPLSVNFCLRLVSCREAHLTLNPNVKMNSRVLIRRLAATVDTFSLSLFLPQPFGIRSLNTQRQYVQPFYKRS